MGLGEMLKTQLGLLWKFLGFFQPPVLRFLHALVVCLIARTITRPLAAEDRRDCDAAGHGIRRHRAPG